MHRKPTFSFDYFLAANLTSARPSAVSKRVATLCSIAGVAVNSLGCRDKGTDHHHHQQH